MKIAVVGVFAFVLAALACGDAYNTKHEAATTKTSLFVPGDPYHDNVVAGGAPAVDGDPLHQTSQIARRTSHHDHQHHHPHGGGGGGDSDGGGAPITSPDPTSRPGPPPVSSDYGGGGSEHQPWGPHSPPDWTDSGTSVYDYPSGPTTTSTPSQPQSHSRGGPDYGSDSDHHHGHHSDDDDDDDDYSDDSDGDDDDDDDDDDDGSDRVLKIPVHWTVLICGAVVICAIGSCLLVIFLWHKKMKQSKSYELMDIEIPETSLTSENQTAVIVTPINNAPATNGKLYPENPIVPPCYPPPTIPPPINN